MASTIKIQLSFFFLLASVLYFSPQIQARESKSLSFFSHFRTTNDLIQIQPHVVLHKKAKAPAPAPTAVTVPAAAGLDQLAPTDPTPSSDSEPSFFANNGDSYGLYGVDDSRESFSARPKETPTTSENEVFNEELAGESFRTGYPKTNLYGNNYGSSPSRNFNNQGNGNSYNNGGYSNSHSGSYYNSNYNYYDGKGYEGKRGEGLRDAENEGYYDKSKYPNEFNTMEEYERQQRSQGYVP